MQYGGVPCSICIHPERDSIEAAIGQGISSRAIAKRFGVGNVPVGKHRAEHLTAAVARGFDLREMTRCKDLAGRVEFLLLETADILEAAREGKQEVVCPYHEERVTFEVKTNSVRDRVTAAREVRETLRLVGELSGKLTSGNVTLLFADLGVSDAEEMRRIVERDRASSNVELDEDLLEDCLSTAAMILAERPDLWERARAMFNERATRPALPAHENGSPA